MTCDCCGSTTWTPRFAENGITLRQCESCDLLSIDDIPVPEKRMTEMEEGHYAGNLSIVDASKQSRAEQVQLARFENFVRLGREHVPGGRWLDIGCGAGVLLQVAQREGFEVEGIELSADRRALAAQATGATIHGRPVEDVAYPDASFDVISLINVFSHLISPMHTFGELRRILRPGGVVVMATGEMTAGVAKADMLHWNLGDHLHFLGDRTMQRYADTVGFEVLHHDRQWLPDAMFSREWLRAKGRSGPKNALKTTIDRTPGGLALLRAVMLRRQADSSAHASEFVLRTTQQD